MTELSQPRGAAMPVFNRLLGSWRQGVIYIGFVVVFAFFSITLSDQGFLDPNNLLNIIRQTAMISVMAVAMTFVLAAGEIDLSVGAVAGLASVVAALLLREYGLVAGILGGLTSGLIVGTINGVLVTRVGIPSFLVTLAMMGVATGTSMWISNTAAIPILNQTYTYFFGSGSIGTFPILFIWVFVVGLIGHIILRKTSFGRRVLATGGNDTAAHYSGVNTNNIKLKVLMLSATTAALAGMLYAGRLQSGRYQFGEGDELSVIAAAVLGGNSLMGGTGTVIGAIVGALMIGLINNGLILLGLDYSQQQIARGIIIVLAVALSQRSSLR